MGNFVRFYFENCSCNLWLSEELRWREEIFTQNCPDIIISGHHQWIIMCSVMTNQSAGCSHLTNHSSAFIVQQIWVNYDSEILEVWNFWQRLKEQFKTFETNSSSIKTRDLNVKNRHHSRQLRKNIAIYLREISWLSCWSQLIQTLTQLQASLPPEVLSQLQPPPTTCRWPGSRGCGSAAPAISASLPCQPPG